MFVLMHTKVSQDEGGKQEPTEEPTQIAKTEQPEKLNDNTPNENNGKRPTKERTDLEDEGGSITKEEEPTRIARVEEPSEPTTNNGAQEAGAGGSDENDSTLSGMLDNQQPTEKLVQAAKLGLPDKRSDDVLNNGSRTDNGDEGGKTKEKAIQFGRVEAALRSVSKSDLPSGSIDEVGGSKGRQLILSKAKIEYGETDIPLTSIDDGGAGVDDVIQTKEPPLFKSKRGTRFVYQIPEDTFIHSDPNAELTIDAKMKDGSPLESWMSFDQGKMQISGEIPMNHSSNIEVEVLAYDQSGDEAMVEVMIEVK